MVHTLLPTYARQAAAHKTVNDAVPLTPSRNTPLLRPELPNQAQARSPLNIPQAWMALVTVLICPLAQLAHSAPGSQGNRVTLGHKTLALTS